MILISCETIEFLKDLIDLHIPTPRSYLISTIALDIDLIWNVSYDCDHLTFINLIKGLISCSLSTLLNTLFNDCKITFIVISSLMNYIYDSIQDNIWLPCYERMIDLEISKIFWLIQRKNVILYRLNIQQLLPDLQLMIFL